MLIWIATLLLRTAENIASIRITFRML